MTTDIIPRTLVVERELGRLDPMYLTPISDTHLEAAACNAGGLRAMLKKRADLPNHSAVVIGDVMNLIGGFDPRNKPSTLSRVLHGVDAWVNEGIDLATDILKVDGIKWDLIGMGNHESSHLRYHGFDATSVLAHNLGAARGGYSGVIDYRLSIHAGTTTRTKSVSRTRIRVLWNHGAWGGRYAKGYIGAKPYFSQFDDWQIAIYGHCHGPVHHPIARIRVRHDGTQEKYTAHIVNCGSWEEGYAEDARDVRYAEKRGLEYQPLLSPLIKVQPVWYGPKANLLTTDVTVTM